MRLALREFPDAPRMVPVDGRHMYTDGRTWWPSASALVNAVRPYDGPDFDKSDPNGPSQVGTRTHAAMETIVRGGEPDLTGDPAVAAHVRHLRLHLERVGDVYAIEQPLVSRSLGLAGTADLICEYDGAVAILDWKTKRKLPYGEVLRGHFLQAAVYAQAYYEMTGSPAERGVVVASVGTSSQAFTATNEETNKYLYSDRVMRCLYELRGETS